KYLLIGASLIALSACDRFQAETHGPVADMALAYMAKSDPAGAVRASHLSDPLSDPEVEYYAALPKLQPVLAVDNGLGEVTDPDCAVPVAQPDPDIAKYRSVIADMKRATAEDYMVKSAQAGFAKAEIAVANLIDRGVVPEALQDDEVSPMPWMEKAAKQGDTNAQYQLGQYYENGRFADRDGAQAVAWYAKAADANDPRALIALGRLYMDGKQVTRDTDRALDYYRRAADLNQPKAEAALGNAYFDGKLVPQDDAQAVKYYQKAAKHCNHVAEYRLGFLYQTGRGVDRDDARAAELYRTAARTQPGAAYNLGLMYQKGEVIAQDDAKAAAAFKLGADRGDWQSEAALAGMYEAGRGVDKDAGKARDLYCRAGNAGDIGSKIACGRLNTELGIAQAFSGGSASASATSAD
ncbi:MAG: tetratricopeptide repeat protein, partial [Asticcacaulis sp.]